MRRRLFLAAAVLPLAAATFAYGCGSDEPPIESVCRWMADPHNCYREFHADTVVDGKAKCATAGEPTLPDDVNLTGNSNGSFLSREALDVCFISQGGSVVFDPPIDLATFGKIIDINTPPVPTKMVIKDAMGNECGSASYTSSYSFSLTINPPPDTGVPATPTDAGTDAADFPCDGSAADCAKIQNLVELNNGIAACDAGFQECIETPHPDGTYLQQVVAGRDTFDSTCPSGESHHFLLLEANNNGVSACPGLAAYVPQAFLILNPGGVNEDGSISFAILYPPLTGTYPGSEEDPEKATIVEAGNVVPPDIVTYFNCAIPAAPEACADGMKGGAETDIDCGGNEVKPDCPVRCGDGQGCINDCDCVDPLTCQVQMGIRKCAAPAAPVVKDCQNTFVCANGVKDGDEGGIDCGGSCPNLCPNDSPCNVNEDCVNGFCNAGKCDDAACDDKVKNGAEGDVDCGATCPTQCANGQTCNVNADCVEKGCVMGVCVTPTCSDGAADGDESDVDCGGICPDCADGKKCVMGSDCASATCLPSNGGNFCFPATCGNTMIDPPETDTDCGGGMCPLCADGSACAMASDCANGVCGADTAATTACFPATCGNNTKDAPETDTDCGGGVCPLCAAGKFCSATTDCLSGMCNVVCQ